MVQGRAPHWRAGRGSLTTRTDFAEDVLVSGNYCVLRGVEKATRVLVLRLKK
jgi:hypothetical protein